MYRILNGGYFTKHPQTFSMERPLGFDHYVFLFIRSEAVLSISGQSYTVMSNSYLFIRPHVPYSYSNPHGPYMDDWIHFECTGQEPDSLPASLFHQPFPCNNPSIISTYMEQLLWESSFAPQEFREEHAHQLFRIILHHACQDFFNRSSYHPYRFQMQKQRIAMQSEPYQPHKADNMSHALGISLSYYEHLYKQFFGQSFHSDLINMRIEYAKDLLKNSTMPLEQISYKCGYHSEVHFYRQFLTKTGSTPGDYRKSNK